MIILSEPFMKNWYDKIRQEIIIKKLLQSAFEVYYKVCKVLQSVKVIAKWGNIVPILKNIYINIKFPKQEKKHLKIFSLFCPLLII